MRSILVTGAGGYIGRHVVSNLLDQGFNVIATDIFVDGIDDRAVKIKKDIFTENKNIYEELGSPDVCLHMAWKDGFVHNSDTHIKMLPLHYEFIDHMIQGGLKHITIMGTMHEVGYYEGPIDENTPCNPISLYGIAKDALRRSIFLMLQEKNVVVQWLRAYYIYGDDKKNHSIFAKLMIADEENSEFFPFTTGKNKYDFITVDELAKQISACVIQNKINGIINCCTGIPISLADKVESFIKDNGLKIKLQYGVYPDRIYDSPAVWGNPTKIKMILKDEGLPNGTGKRKDESIF